MLLLFLSAAMISRLCRFVSVAVLPLPLVLMGVSVPEFTPSVLLGPDTESDEEFFSLELPSFSPNFLKGFLRNDMFASVNRVL